jgi:hypothetical protein
VHREIFEPEGVEVQGSVDNCVMKVSRLLRLIAVWSLNKGGEIGGAFTHVWGRGEVHPGFWWGNLKEKDHLKDTGVGGLKRNSITGRGLKTCGLGLGLVAGCRECGI